MFLSQLVLNLRNPAVRRDLSRPYEMHRTLLTCGFGRQTKDELGRVLFRVDANPYGGPPVVLVQSAAVPDWSDLPDGYAVKVPTPKPFSVSVSAGQRLRFRLRANPTKRVHQRATSRPNEAVEPRWVGKRVGFLGEDEQLRWLLRKGAQGGFAIPGEWLKPRDPRTNQPIDVMDPITGRELLIPNFRVDAIPEGRVGNDKLGAAGGFVAVRFEGLLEVTNPAAFAATIAAGVGSGKGYGFGLLSVAPA